MKTCNWGFFPSIVVQHQCQLGLSYLSERRYICCVVVSFLSLLLLLLTYIILAFWWLYVRSFSLILQRLFFLGRSPCNTLKCVILWIFFSFFFLFLLFVIVSFVRLAVYTRPYTSIAMGYTKRTRMRHRGGQQQPAESCWIVHGSIRHVRSNSTK